MDGHFLFHHRVITNQSDDGVHILLALLDWILIHQLKGDPYLRFGPRMSS